MQNVTVNHTRNFAIIGHSGDGKTTLGEDSAGNERMGPMIGGASGVCTMVSKSVANTCGL